MNPSLSSAEQLKIIASTLCKMGRFFNQMTELCLLQLAGGDSLRDKHRTALNRENLRNFENNRNLEKLKTKEHERERESRMEKIKNLKPKHPVSSFFVFYRDKGQEIAKAKGEVLGSRIAKIVGEMWKSMSEAEREPYEAKSRETRLKYEEQMAVYRLKYSDEIAKLKKYKRELKELKNKRQVLLKQADFQGKVQESVRGVEQRGGMGARGALSEEDSLLEASNLMSDSLDQSHQLPESQSSSAQCKLEHHQETLKDVKQEDLSPLSEEEIRQISQMEKGSLDKGLTVKQELKQEHKHQSEVKYEQKQDEIHHLKAIAPMRTINGPKRPISSFFLFYRAEGKRIAEENQLSLGPRTIELASQLWKDMSAGERQRYQRLSEEMRSKQGQQTEEAKKGEGRKQGK